MQGIIYMQLKKFVVTTVGKDDWTQLLDKSGLESRLYLPTNTYPDEEFSTLLSAISKASDRSRSAILEEFGQFVVPELFALYGTFISPEWKTLDLIENTEQTIHKVVRLRNPGADPARLKTIRRTIDEIEVTYDSPRKMCSLAKGIIHGVAAHYEERVSIDESRCMLMGDNCCKLYVKKEVI